MPFLRGSKLAGLVLFAQCVGLVLGDVELFVLAFVVRCGGISDSGP